MNCVFFRIANAEEPVRAADVRAEDFLTPEQLAQRLQVELSWIYEQTRSRAGTRNGNGNSLPYVRMGKYLRFYWPDVARWLEKRQHSHATTRKEHKA